MTARRTITPLHDRAWRSDCQTALRRPGRWLVSCSLLAAAGAQALGLGGPQGSVLIGRSLELAIPLQLEIGDDPAALCPQAEVHHGEVRQDQRGVRVSIDLANPLRPLIRLSSAPPVDEPSVSVLVRLGCAQTVSRRYVLLADPPPTSAVPVAPVASVAPTAPVAATVEPAVPATPAVSAAAPTASAAAAPSTGAARPVAAAARTGVPAAVAPSSLPARAIVPPSVPKAADATPPRPAASAAAGTAARPAPAPAGPRLTLLPALPALPALAASAPPSVSEASRLETLERDLKALRTLASRQDAALLDVRTRLQRAESDQVPVGVVYGLMALVLLCLVAVGWLWSRLRRLRQETGNWWSPSALVPDSALTPVAPSPAREGLAGH